MSSTSNKSSKGTSTPSATAGGQRTPATTGGGTARAKKDTSAVDARRRQNRLIAIAGMAIVAVLAVVVGWTFLSRPSGDVAAGTGGAAMASQGTVEQGNGGQWTNVSPDTLAAMLGKKDFTFVNVKTPYIGEIEGTDLYIPYTDLAARASGLPKDKAAPVVVGLRARRHERMGAERPVPPAVARRARRAEAFRHVPAATLRS